MSLWCLYYWLYTDFTCCLNFWLWTSQYRLGKHLKVDNFRKSKRKNSIAMTSVTTQKATFSTNDFFIFFVVGRIFHANVNQISSSKSPGCSAFLFCYLIGTRPTLGHYCWPESYREPLNEVGYFKPGRTSSRVWRGNLPIHSLPYPTRALSPLVIA